MLTDPLSVNYDGTVRSLPRVSVSGSGSIYRTADSELEIKISSSTTRSGLELRSISLSRLLPDPTPADVFDAYRAIKNTFMYSYMFNSNRAGLSDDLPKIRVALQSFVDSTLQGRIIGGEK